ncbi:homologous-pairing protein 2 homolog [Oscarella lobularis]|uniref:homologous-pairing protein 2 homolog n=1 Tax=Oscarella lobularis TaxID=121494 RepID=UPI0033133F77
MRFAIIEFRRGMSKKDAEASAAVLDYLRTQNRPYSAVDVFNNLHKKYGKTAVTRSLEALGAKGTIKEKVYGKQKVYVANQSDFPAVDESELKEMDVNVGQLTETSKSLLAECKEQEAELKALELSLTTEEAEAKLASLREECGKLEERLEKIKKESDHVTPEDRDKICKKHTTMVKAWRKRKRLAMDILNAILEGYPKSKKQLFEEVGVETDEEYNVKMPSEL